MSHEPRLSTVANAFFSSDNDTESVDEDERYRLASPEFRALNYELRKCT